MRNVNTGLYCYSVAGLIMPLTGRCTRLRSGGLRQFLPLVGRFKFIIFVAVLICCKLSCCDEAVNNRLYIILGPYICSSRRRRTRRCSSCRSSFRTSRTRHSEYGLHTTSERAGLLSRGNKPTTRVYNAGLSRTPLAIRMTYDSYSR